MLKLSVILCFFLLRNLEKEKTW